MSKSYISKTNNKENIQNSLDSRKSYEELACFFDCHSKHLCNIFTFELDLKSLIIISCSLTCFTLYIDIWEKVHLYFLSTTSFTYLTPSPSSIKRKSPWAKSTFLCIKRSCKYFTNIGKYSCVCGDIGMWGFTYW